MAWTRNGQALERFGAQFEPDGDAFLYRRNLKSAPIRLTAEEKSRFTDDYRRGLRRLTWGFAGGMLLLLAATIAPIILTDREPGQWLIYFAMAGAIVPFLILHQRLWNAPARALAGRTPVGAKRSRGEVQRATLARLSWGHLAATFLVVPLLLIKASSAADIWRGWGQLWLVFAGVVTMLLIYQAIRKWQISAGGD